nr:MAG: internal scaffolding protein [Microvirus sp.]
MRKIKIPGLYDENAVSIQTGLASDSSEDRTIQSFGHEQNINTIVRRFGAGGELQRPRTPPEFGDFSQGLDYQTAMETLRRGQESFDSLPAKVRRRFHDDPGELYEWLHQSGNESEAIELGLMPDRRAGAASEARSVPEAADVPPSAPEAV